MANPFLVLGGVAVGVITAGVGVLQVPGWIASAQDASAKNDIEQVTIAEAAAMTVNGEYEASIADLNAAGTGTKVTQSNGVEVEIAVDGDSYIVVTKSASGKFFARIDGGKIGSGDSVADAVADTGETFSGTLPTFD